MELIGKRVLFQVSTASWEEGIVKSYDDESGKVTVVDDEGQKWRGWEYQLEPIGEDDRAN